MALGPLMVDVEGLVLSPAEAQQLKDPLIGGVILFSRNYQHRSQLSALVCDIRSVRTPALLIAVDQEGGRVQRFREGFTALPGLHWLGAQYELDAAKARRLANLCGWILAAELIEVGVDFSFAPVVDLDRGLSEVIGDRAIHRDIEIVSTLALAMMQGMRKAGMVAVAKHFPGHGGVVQDSHKELPEDHRAYSDLLDDIEPFRRLIEHELHGVMMAHVRYPQVDQAVASLSPYWLQTELRQTLGFTGAIFSDDLQMHALDFVGSIPERVRLTLDAGADMALICNNPEAVAQTLVELKAYQNPVAQVRLAAMRSHPPADGSRLRDSSRWRDAVATLDKAMERPGLELDGYSA